MESINPLDILKSGLPQTGQPGRHIVIIGAGMAGLTAGLLLQEAGHKVTILEAQNRLGGRVFTYHGFPGKMYGEFGAMRFPRQHKLAQHLIHERFKLATQPFPMYDEDTFIYVNGSRMRRSEFHPDKIDFNLPQHEKGKLPDELLKNVMQPLIDLMSQENGWERLINDYDEFSLIDYLRESELSDAALSMVGLLLNLEGRYHFSLVEWFSHYYENVFGDLVYIEDGASSLPNAFAPHLMGSIRLGAEVHAIDQTGDGVAVHFNSAGNIPRVCRQPVGKRAENPVGYLCNHAPDEGFQSHQPAHLGDRIFHRLLQRQRWCVYSDDWWGISRVWPRQQLRRTSTAYA